MLFVNENIQIPDSEFQFSYARSSGPGGQAVNKVNSKALLRWAPESSPALPLPVLERFLKRYGHKLTLDGELLIASDRFRDQKSNQRDCLEKLQAMLLEVANPPKKRIKTKPSKSSQKKRKENKKRHSQKKKLRQQSRDFE